MRGCRVWPGVDLLSSINHQASGSCPRWGFHPLYVVLSRGEWVGLSSAIFHVCLSLPFWGRGAEAVHSANGLSWVPRIVKHRQWLGYRHSLIQMFDYSKVKDMTTHGAGMFVNNFFLLFVFNSTLGSEWWLRGRDAFRVSHVGVSRWS